MVQATREQVITIQLKLSQDEANWLKGIMQNPLFGNDPSEEDPYTRKMRAKFWDALNEDLDSGISVPVAPWAGPVNS